MKIQSAQQKGKELEDFIVNRLRLSGLDKRAYRQKGSGSGLNKGDVWNALNIHFEAKNQKQASFKEWFKQMADENVSHLPEVLVWHLPQTSLENSKVIIDWHYFESLLLKSKTPTTISTPNREVKYLIEKSRQDLHELLKRLDN